MFLMMKNPLKIRYNNYNTKYVHIYMYTCNINKYIFQAKTLFLKGIEYEEERKFYEAIQFYKRAVLLVPDIEFRLYETTKVKSNDDRAEGFDTDANHIDDNVENHNEEDEEENDLFVKLCKIVNQNKCVCFPKFEQNVSIHT